MRSIYFRFILILFITPVCISCKEFWLESIAGEEITLTNPSNNEILSHFTVNFNWSEIKGAEYYKILINSINTVTTKIDSQVFGSEIPITLIPGNYEWKVNAFGGGDSISSENFFFTIDSVSTNSSFFNLKPSNGEYLNSEKITFSWKIEGYEVEDYRLDIYKNSWNGDLILSEIVYVDSFSISLENGPFFWQVSAKNRNQNPISSLPQEFTIDTIPPSTPIFQLPIPDTIIFTDSIFFSWSNDFINGTNTNDSIYIISNEGTLENIYFSGSYDSEMEKTLELENLVIGKYYSFIIRKDLARNTAISDTLYFEVK